MQDRPNTRRVLILNTGTAGRQQWRRMLMRHFKEPLQLMSAGNERRALDILKRQPQDCVLLDIRLGSMSGLQFIRQLPREIVENTVFVVVIDKKAEEETVRHFQLGIKDYLIRNRYNGGQLARTVRNAIEKGALQRELAYSKKELQERNKTLEHFAYIAAHDLQSPLRTIKGFVDLLISDLDERLGQQEREYFQYIHDASTRMGDLIRDLLELAKTDNPPVRLGPADTNQIVRDVLLDLDIYIISKRARIRCHPLPAVNADSGQLYRIFLNLISNALKFNKRPPISVEIGGEKHDHHTRFWVRDNGMGMEPAQAENIFKPFKRLNQAAPQSGSGLGLAICKKAVERHHGRIWLESEPGKGSTFFFSIPDRAEERDAEQPVGPAER